MSTAGWVFLIGFRVFDLGAMVAWLLWFRKQDGGTDDGWGDGGGDEPPGPTGPPQPDADPWPTRRRDHGSPEPTRRPARRSAPEPHRTPVRTRD